MTDEITQAAIYGDLIRRAACDADIAAVSFFGFRTTPLAPGSRPRCCGRTWTARPAAAAVRDAIAATGEGCSGAPVRWEPGDGVLDPRIEIGPARAETVATASSSGRTPGPSCA